MGDKARTLTESFDTLKCLKPWKRYDRPIQRESEAIQPDDVGVQECAEGQFVNWDTHRRLREDYEALRKERDELRKENHELR